MSSKFKEALLRTFLVGASPQTKDELLLIADALKIWKKHPELRHSAIAKDETTADSYLTRIGMMLAMVKFGVDDVPEGVGDDYTPPADDEEPSNG